MHLLYDPGGCAQIHSQDILSFSEIIRFVEVLKRNFGLSSVRITGGEPLVRRGVVDLVKMLAEQSLLFVGSIRFRPCLALRHDFFLSSSNPDPRFRP